MQRQRRGCNKVNSVTLAHQAIYTDRMQRFEVCGTEMSLLSFWLALSLVFDVIYVTTKASSHENSSVVASLRHRVMITPVGALCIRLIDVSRVTGQFIARLELFLNGNCPLIWNSNPMFHANPLLWKGYSIWYELYFKISDCRRQFGLQRMSPRKTLRTRLIHISPSYWTIYRSFESIPEWELSAFLEWELSIGMKFKSNVLCKSIASKNIVWLELYLKKILQRVSPSKSRANEVERTPITDDSFWFRSPATWTRKARHGTKICE